MKKRVACIFITVVMSLSLIACGSTTTTSNETESESMDETAEADTDKESSDEDDTTSDLEAVGDVEVDEGLLTVSITVPADFVEDETQEDLDADVAEEGFISATLNEDGSATYTMTKKKHRELMEEMEAGLDEALNEMVGSEDYPNITSIEHNDNFTKFTVTTKSQELDINETFAIYAYFMYGALYNIYNGTNDDLIYYIDYINADSGEVIFSSNSDEMSNTTTE